MYILFINLVGYILFIIELQYSLCIFFLSTQVTSEIYFFAQFINNSNKNKNCPTWPNFIHVGWVEPLWWIGLGRKIPLIRPNLIHAHLYNYNT